MEVRARAKLATYRLIGESLVEQRRRLFLQILGSILSPLCSTIKTIVLRQIQFLHFLLMSAISLMWLKPLLIASNLQHSKTNFVFCIWCDQLFLARQHFHSRSSLMSVDRSLANISITLYFQLRVPRTFITYSIACVILYQSQNMVWHQTTPILSSNKHQHFRYYLSRSSLMYF